MRAVYLSKEAVTEVLTALHGCKSQLGDVANLSKAIELLERAESAPDSSPAPIIDLDGQPYVEPEHRTPHFDEDNWPPEEEDMPPMPGAGLDIPDDKSGGVATMAKELLRGSSPDDRGRPKPKPYA